jgi:hypothetical protein
MHDDDLLMPPWAIGRLRGQLILGAHLATRDGRRCGNAHIVLISPSRHVPGEENYKVLTDAGSEMTCTAEEIQELFYPTQWLSDLSEVLLKFGAKNVHDPR